MLPVGPDPRAAISEGFFAIIEANKDKLADPNTVKVGQQLVIPN